jgi:hypothetical protein
MLPSASSPIPSFLLDLSAYMLEARILSEYGRTSDNISDSMVIK